MVMSRVLTWLIQAVFFKSQHKYFLWLLPIDSEDSLFTPVTQLAILKWKSYSLGKYYANRWVLKGKSNFPPKSQQNKLLFFLSSVVRRKRPLDQLKTTHLFHSTIKLKNLALLQTPLLMQRKYNKDTHTCRHGCRVCVCVCVPQCKQTNTNSVRGCCFIRTRRLVLEREWIS